MTITNGYADLNTLTSRLDIEDNADQVRIERIIEAVSRFIDLDRSSVPNKIWRRRFYTTSETRYYTATNGTLCLIDDLVSVTSVKLDLDDDGVYETTLDSGDYVLSPKNAALDDLPYTYLRIVGTTGFPLTADSVEVTGDFGFCAAADLPPPIKEACVKITERVFMRDDLIFGTAGSADLGTVEAIIPLGKDGEIQALLSAIPQRDEEQEAELLATVPSSGYERPTMFSVASGTRGQ